MILNPNSENVFKNELSAKSCVKTLWSLKKCGCQSTRKKIWSNKKMVCILNVGQY